ncbi:MAG: hypothetical protein U9Q06_00580 [Nanoarchaeota archaeon]|nr:hypothetical protein [Nanoarchaeota archaeon]
MEWWQILILIIAGAIAIRFSVKFDLNKFLEERRKIKISQLQNICPHCKIEILGKDKKQIKCTPYFYSPTGTLNQICSRCKCVVPFEEDVKRICGNYANDPQKWLEQENKFIKQMKKLKIC